MTRILFLGDTHAAWHRLVDGITLAVAREQIDLAIQVGDFGFFKAYAPAPLGTRSVFHLAVPTYVIDGNHEDHEWLAAQRQSGALARWAQEQNLHVMPRGSILRVNDLTIGFCGGALHADRRQEGSIDRGTTNWVTFKEAEAAAAVFSQAKVDVIVTHSCPHSIGVGMVGSPYLVEDVERHCVQKGFHPGSISDCGEPGLRRLWSHLTHRPREWIFGHFHAHREAMVRGVQFRCIGAIDGSDQRTYPVGYVLETDGWLFRPLAIGGTTDQRQHEHQSPTC